MCLHLIFKVLVALKYVCFVLDFTLLLFSAPSDAFMQPGKEILSTA